MSRLNRYYSVAIAIRWLNTKNWQNKDHHGHPTQHNKPNSQQQQQQQQQTAGKVEHLRYLQK